LLIKYIKSVLWRVAKCLSYIEEARCVKVKEPRTKSNLYLTVRTKHWFQQCVCTLKKTYNFNNRWTVHHAL